MNLISLPIDCISVILNHLSVICDPITIINLLCSHSTVKHFILSLHNEYQFLRLFCCPLLYLFSDPIYFPSIEFSNSILNISKYHKHMSFQQVQYLKRFQFHAFGITAYELTHQFHFNLFFQHFQFATHVTKDHQQQAIERLVFLMNYIPWHFETVLEYCQFDSSILLLAKKAKFFNYEFIHYEKEICTALRKDWISLTHFVNWLKTLPKCYYMYVHFRVWRQIALERKDWKNLLELLLLKPNISNMDDLPQECLDYLIEECPFLQLNLVRKNTIVKSKYIQFVNQNVGTCNEPITKELLYKNPFLFSSLRETTIQFSKEELNYFVNLQGDNFPAFELFLPLKEVFEICVQKSKIIHSIQNALYSFINSKIQFASKLIADFFDRFTLLPEEEKLKTIHQDLNLYPKVSFKNQKLNELFIRRKFYNSSLMEHKFDSQKEWEYTINTIIPTMPRHYLLNFHRFMFEANATKYNFLSTTIYSAPPEQSDQYKQYFISFANPQLYNLLDIFKLLTYQKQIISDEIFLLAVRYLPMGYFLLHPTQQYLTWKAFVQNFYCTKADGNRIQKLQNWIEEMETWQSKKLDDIIKENGRFLCYTKEWTTERIQNAIASSPLALLSVLITREQNTVPMFTIPNIDGRMQNLLQPLLEKIN